MKVSDTIIKWNYVNMRAADKCLPEEHKEIVYYDGGIRSGRVFMRKGKLCVNPEFKSKEIKTGFIWCYQNDILTPEEI